VVDSKMVGEMLVVLTPFFGLCSGTKMKPSASAAVSRVPMSYWLQSIPIEPWGSLELALRLAAARLVDLFSLGVTISIRYGPGWRTNYPIR